MSARSDPPPQLEAVQPGQAPQRAEELAELAARAGIRIAVAESLTAGQISATLGAASETSTWFRGAVVAYSRAVKHDLLGVPEGPVVSPEAATVMAREVRRLLEATLTIGVTGAGGPGPQDGAEPGSVWFAVATDDTVFTYHRHFLGTPAEILEQTVAYAIALLLEAARQHTD